MRFLAASFFALLVGCHGGGSAQTRLAGRILVGAENELGGLPVVAIGPTTVATTTDGIGRYELALAPGAYHIVASAPSTNEGQLSIDVDTSSATTLPNFVFSPLGEIGGGPISDGQTPLAAVVVGVDGTAAQTVSDSDGTFTLTGIPVGAHTLYALAPGFAPATSGTFTVKWNARASAGPLVLARDTTSANQMTITVALVGRSDASGVVATLTPGKRTGTSDAAGRIVIDGLESGVYAVHLETAGYVYDIPQLFFGNGTLYVPGQWTQPIDTITLNRGHLITTSTQGDDLERWAFDGFRRRVLDVFADGAVAFDPKSLGLTTIYMLRPLTAGEKWMFMLASSDPSGAPRSLYAVSMGDWALQPLAVIDNQTNLAVLDLEQAIIANVPRGDGTSSTFRFATDGSAPLDLGPGQPSAATSLLSSDRTLAQLWQTGGGVRLVRISDGSSVATSTAAANTPCWVPHRNYVVYDREGTIYKLGVDLAETAIGASTTELTHDGWTRPGADGTCTFHPWHGELTSDGATSFDSDGTSLARWDVATNAKTVLTTANAAPLKLHLFETAGVVAFVVGSSPHAELHVYDLATAHDTTLSNINTYAPSSDHLVYLDEDGTLWSLVAGSLTPIRLAESVTMFAVHPRGALVAFVTTDKVVHTAPLDGGTATDLGIHATPPLRWVTATRLEYRTEAPINLPLGAYWVTP